ncbi:putative quinol monooxygenase (plasmid) [Arthrobacter sp. UC242_113]|uniref:putative quinol monooxygenase n=1 Tax=Arthrobacter sp. UC242_113 TaxID=3374550 RepID=UPI003757CF24
MTVTTVAHYRFPPAAREAVLERLLPVAQTTRDEPGLKYFHILETPSEEGHLILIEGWKDQEALARHRERPHFRDGLLGSVVPLLYERSVHISTPAFEEQFS